MNIFRLHDDPRIAAKHHDDSRVVKMCLEAAQCLATGLRIRARDPTSPFTEAYCDDLGVYEAFNADNRLPHWAAESQSNLWTVFDLVKSLADEHYQRFEPTDFHDSWYRARQWEELIELVPDHGDTKQPYQGNDQYEKNDIVAAYRDYYAYEKGADAGYVRTDAPPWWPDDAPQPTTSV